MTLTTTQAIDALVARKPSLRTVHTPRELIHQAVRCVKTAADMRWVARVSGEPLDHARHADFLRWAAVKRQKAALALVSAKTSRKAA